ncbi:protein of unknown function [Fibrobacter sp. UWT3]|uniref:GIY-YIG nuclease family protein n=1 Tax=Fibrobacter sp. UWT3 TaxID=1896225 RepID=UPI000BCE677B|nr:GIY-YIG nuclease family protein [Fibrobacter sp. UWT3]SOE75856.1 protein of unknown function [Fibrobacter sp. UWT3]
MEKQGRKIVVEFKNDNPNGIRIVRNPSFPFDAYIIPRCCMSETTNVIPEKKIGVYFLFDENRTQVYIGQTGDGLGRLQTHHQQKDFWSIAIMFLAEKDKWISLIDELETYSIIRLEKAEKGTRFKLQNKKKLGRKEESLTNLSEIKKIFFEIKFCLAAFEYNIETSSTKMGNPDSSAVPVQATRGGINANGLFNPNDGSIIVKAGSEIRLDDNLPANGDSIEKLRQEFKDKGKIKKVKGKYILQEDVHFGKLSPAAEFVIGGSCNGKTEWKSNGKTLKELFKL